MYGIPSVIFSSAISSFHGTTDSTTSASGDEIKFPIGKSGIEVAKTQEKNPEKIKIFVNIDNWEIYSGKKTHTNFFLSNVSIGKQ